MHFNKRKHSNQHCRSMCKLIYLSLTVALWISSPRGRLHVIHTKPWIRRPHLNVLCLLNTHRLFTNLFIPLNPDAFTKIPHHVISFEFLRDFAFTTMLLFACADTSVFRVCVQAPFVSLSCLLRLQGRSQMTFLRVPKRVLLHPASKERCHYCSRQTCSI